MKRRLFLNVIVTQGAAILQLLSGKNKTLLIRWDTIDENPNIQVKKRVSCKKNWNLPFLILDFGFDIVDGVRRLDLKGDRLSR